MYLLTYLRTYVLTYLLTYLLTYSIISMYDSLKKITTICLRKAIYQYKNVYTRYDTSISDLA